MLAIMLSQGMRRKRAEQFWRRAQLQTLNSVSLSVPYQVGGGELNEFLSACYVCVCVCAARQGELNQVFRRAHRVRVWRRTQ